MVLRTFIVGALLLTPGMASATPSLAGIWGGGRHMLSMTATGARIATDCAFAEFPAPVPDAEGHFSASGRMYGGSPGPDAGDTPDKGKPVRITGRIDGDMLDLTLAVEGGVPQTLHLVRGQRVKLVRCL